MISGLHSTHQDESPTKSKDIRLQWRCLPFVYVVYRCLVALYFVTWLVLSGVWKYDWAASDDDRIKWFIYLTNWSFFALTANVVLQAALVGGTYGKMGEYKVGTQTGTHAKHLVVVAPLYVILILFFITYEST